MQTATLSGTRLNRDVQIDWVDTRPEGNPALPPRLLVFNDGQDAPAFQMASLVQDFSRQSRNPGVLALAVHVGERKQEYGIGREPDYDKRGSRAADYREFIQTELFDWIRQQFHWEPGPEVCAMAGFSLGALSAFDVVWNLPDRFQTGALFSGSFWWRAKALDKGYQPSDRIAHRMVAETPPPAGARFWFQTGLLDEHADRDQDGLIDSVGDTLDLILALEKQGFAPGQDVEYVEVSQGRHDHKTMARVLPDFLEWWCRTNS